MDRLCKGSHNFFPLIPHGVNLPEDTIDFIKNSFLNEYCEYRERIIASLEHHWLDTIHYGKAETYKLKRGIFLSDEFWKVPDDEFVYILEFKFEAPSMISYQRFFILNNRDIITKHLKK